MLFDENKKTFDKIFGLKEDIKEIRGTIFEFRNKIMRSIDQSLTFQKSENGSSKLGQSLSKIKFEMQVITCFQKSDFYEWGNWRTSVHAEVPLTCPGHFTPAI